MLADPATACGEVTNGDRFRGKIVLVERGDCMFIGAYHEHKKKKNPYDINPVLLQRKPE